MQLNSEETNILKILDDAAKAYQFPIINNVGFTSAAIQMRVFTSPDEWLIIFDQFCYSEKHGFIHDITALGNKITNHVRTHTVPLFDEDEQPRVVQNREDGIDWITSPHIRFGVDESIFIKKISKEDYASSEFDKDLAELTPGELLRVMMYCGSSTSFISDQQLLEMAGRSNDELTLLLEPEDWQHPDIANDELPGSIPCFVSLAKAIAARDERLYQCDEDRFNTHWSNWE